MKQYVPGSWTELPLKQQLKRTASCKYVQHAAGNWIVNYCVLMQRKIERTEQPLGLIGCLEALVQIGLSMQAPDCDQ